MEDLDKIEARYPDNDPIDNDVRALIAELRQTRLQLDEARKARETDKTSEFWQERAESAERLNGEYQKALENVVSVLGPKPPDCGCDGCFEEMNQALKYAQGALALNLKGE